ncbi:MAG: NTP transferase domain-containing protein [Candidatus Methylomirabilales bacterium]
MNCLILAAGRGSRLSTPGHPKPLIPLLGVPLIERVILTAHKAGLTHFYVVSGHHGDTVRHFLDTVSPTRNVRITHIINDEWEKENGLSVLKAKDLLVENFILLMADHIFDESILLKLKNQAITDGEVILAVDYNTQSNTLIDPEDVTNVYVENDRIHDIGKNLTQYNAYDTGIFLCSPAIFSAVEESIHNGDTSLSGAIKVMAQRQKAKAFDIRDDYWIDVDDHQTLKKAENRLLATLKKTSDGLISRYVNRPISTRMTRHLVKMDLTPTQISVVSFILSLLGAYFFFLGGYMNLLIGAVFAQLSSVIDGCDGEVARLKYQITKFGGWFDAVLDRYADGFLLLGLTYSVYLTHETFLIIFIGFLAIFGSFMNSYTADKYDGLMKRKLEPGKHYFRIGRDLRMFIIFLGGLANQPLLILVLNAVLMNAENIRRIVLVYKNEKG